MGVTGSSVEGAAAVAPGVLTVSQLITALKPKKYFKCWEIVGAFGISDHGTQPSQSLLNTGTVPLFAAETPMVSDTEQTAIDFNANSGSISTFANAVANFAIGTVFVFFKLTGDVNGNLIVQNQAAAALSQALLIYLSGGAFLFRIRNNGASSALEFALKSIAVCSVSPSRRSLFLTRAPCPCLQPRRLW